MAATSDRYELAQEIRDKCKADGGFSSEVFLSSLKVADFIINRESKRQEK